MLQVVFVVDEFPKYIKTMIISRTINEVKEEGKREKKRGKIG